MSPPALPAGGTARGKLAAPVWVPTPTRKTRPAPVLTVYFILHTTPPPPGIKTATVEKITKEES